MYCSIHTCMQIPHYFSQMLPCEHQVIEVWEYIYIENIHTCIYYTTCLYMHKPMTILKIPLQMLMYELFYQMEIHLEWIFLLILNLICHFLVTGCYSQIPKMARLQCGNNSNYKHYIWLNSLQVLNTLLIHTLSHYVIMFFTCKLHCYLHTLANSYTCVKYNYNFGDII